MNKIFGIAGAAVTALGLSVPAVADDHMDNSEPDWRADRQVEVLQRNAQGKATMVRVGEWTYPVCMNKQMTDGCIQPRAAGLDWGPWPAHTRSSDRSS